MAEGLLNALFGDRYETYSAGSEPTRVHPFAIKAMAEIGIDISSHYSKSIDMFLGKDLDFVVNVCDNANEACPFFPGGKTHIHKGFEDPAGFIGTEEEIMNSFRRVRDEIGNWIKSFFPKQ